MSKEDPSALLKKMVEKLEKSDKRQAELEEKNDVLEKKIAEMNELLTPGDDEEDTEPAKLEPAEPAVHEDPVHEWARKQMVEREEKKKRTREKFRVKPKAEVEADADKLFQGMLLDGQE